MKLFNCPHCQNILHFDSKACVNCHQQVGFCCERMEMVLVEDGTGNSLCANSAFGVCNWVVTPDKAHPLCKACQHNLLIPDLSSQDNVLNWGKMETAKKHLFYSLLRWNLPLMPSPQAPHERLVFKFATDTVREDGEVIEKVMTGHDAGVITINLAEADDAERERRRTAMMEPYRTLIGHFRHEIGHYYWDRLVRDAGKIASFNAVFGDYTRDYQQALERHYREGPPLNWFESYITSYASVHPWEDFAETWAHYIHIIDTLETAQSVGVHIKPTLPTNSLLRTDIDFPLYENTQFDQIIQSWIPLTVAINSINRSMGISDLYPFVLATPVIQKLRFVHNLVHEEAELAQRAIA